jgi:peptide/nickel transport system permease protein
MQQSDAISPEPPLPVADTVVITRPPKSLWRETLERLIRKPSAIVGLVMLSLLVLIAIFAPVIATHDPLTVLLDLPEEGVAQRADPCIHLLGCPGAGDNLVQIATGAPIQMAQISPTNIMLAAASGPTLTVWDAKNGKQLMALEHEQPVRAFSWTPNDQKILTASGEELYVWDINRHAASQTLQHEGGADLVAWNADGTRFLSADAHTARLWDALMWRETAAIALEGDLVTAAWNSNGTVLMTAAGSKVQFWNAFVGTEAGRMEHPSAISSAQFNRASNKILTTSADGLRIWNASTYQQLLFIPYDGALAGAAWNEALARGIEHVMAIDGDTALVWDAKSGELLLQLDHGEPIRGVSGTPLATRIATYGDHTIRVWDTSNGTVALTLTRDTPLANVQWLSAGSGIIVASGNELTITKTANYQYLMGVDGNLRDQFSRVIFGTRVSLLIGLSTVSLAVIVGTIAGAIAGYVSGWADNVIMRVMDVMLAFPSLILAIAVVTVLGPGLINALLAISVVAIPAYARVARSGVLSVKEEDFVIADRALGVSPVRILFRRILPNAMAPLIVQATLGIGTAILDAAALSFLGLGAQPPTPEWGSMLGAEHTQVFTAPHLVFYPGIAIMIIVLSFNLLGDGLRDALDPRLDR